MTPGQLLIGAATAATAAAAAGGAAYYATCSIRAQWLGRTDWHGRTDTGAVALTFDDGPGPDTEALLDTLSARGLRAAFFVVGQQVQRHPSVARRIVAEGHEIGNHSFSHPMFLSQSPRATRDELARAQRTIEDVTGVRVSFARPPYGIRTPAYFAAARGLGLRVVQWSVAGFDWKPVTPDRVASHVLRGARPGAIVLLHDADSEGKRDRRATVESIPMIADGVRVRGLSVSPLDALLPSTEFRSVNA
jgi:peptidoglycan/xylan/chitin deacetylase (PgdA/CDA1 family)